MLGGGGRGKGEEGARSNKISSRSEYLITTVSTLVICENYYQIFVVKI